MNNQPPGNKPPLLLVEDEQDTASLVKLIMEGKGYEVLHSADGSEALDKIALMPPPFTCLAGYSITGCRRRHDSGDDPGHTRLAERAGDHVDRCV